MMSSPSLLSSILPLFFLVMYGRNFACDQPHTVERWKWNYSGLRPLSSGRFLCMASTSYGLLPLCTATKRQLTCWRPTSCMPNGSSVSSSFTANMDPLCFQLLLHCSRHFVSLNYDNHPCIMYGRRSIVKASFHGNYPARNRIIAMASAEQWPVSRALAAVAAAAATTTTRAFFTSLW